MEWQSCPVCLMDTAFVLNRPARSDEQRQEVSTEREVILAAPQNEGTISAYLRIVKVGVQDWRGVGREASLRCVNIRNSSGSRAWYSSASRYRE